MSSNFTIYIPTYNSSKTIFDTLKSLKAQILKPDKIIISDNNSTDNTIEIILNNFTDVEIVINPSSKNFENLTNTEKAISNFNYINSICCSEYFCICHSDDIYNPDYTLIMLNELRINTNTSAVFCRSRIFGKSRNFIPKPTLRNISIYFKKEKKILNHNKLLLYTILYGNILEAPSAMFRTSKIKNIFYKKIFLQAADLHFYFDCTINSNIIFLNKFLYQRRYHNEQDSFYGKSIYFTKNLPFYDLLDYELSIKKDYFNKYILDIYYFNKFIDTIIVNNGKFIINGTYDIIDTDKYNLFSKIYVYLIFPKSMIIHFFYFLFKCLSFFSFNRIIRKLLYIFKFILLR